MTQVTPASGEERRWLRALSWADRLAPGVFLLPATVVVLAMSIFPLVVSLYLSLARFRLGPGGITFEFIGLLNYRKLLFGSEQFHLLGLMHDPSLLAWSIAALIAGGWTLGTIRAARRGASLAGVCGRFVVGLSLIHI